MSAKPAPYTLRDLTLILAAGVVGVLIAGSAP